jgi:hypothetical protein
MVQQHYAKEFYDSSALLKLEIGQDTPKGESMLIHGIEENNATQATYIVQFIVFFEFGPLNGAEGSILLFFFFPPIWFFFALASAAAALSALMFTLSSPVKFLSMIGFGLSSYLRVFVACRAGS